MGEALRYPGTRISGLSGVYVKWLSTVLSESTSPNLALYDSGNSRIPGIQGVREFPDSGNSRTAGEPAGDWSQSGFRWPELTTPDPT